MSKTTVTVTSVPEELKTELQLACVKAGTNPSEELRKWLPRIIAALNGEPESEDETLIIGQAETIKSLRDELRMERRITTIQTRALMKLGDETARRLMRRAKDEIAAESRLEVHSEPGDKRV